jgi:hypothetical protein
LIASSLNAHGKDVYIQLRNYFLVTDLKKNDFASKFQNQFGQRRWSRKYSRCWREHVCVTFLPPACVRHACPPAPPHPQPSRVTIRNTVHNTEPFPQDTSFEIKVMLSRYFINSCAKTTQLYASLMLALDSGEWLASRHSRFNPGEWDPDTRYMEGEWAIGPIYLAPVGNQIGVRRIYSCTDCAVVIEQLGICMHGLNRMRERNTRRYITALNLLNTSEKELDKELKVKR